MLAVMTLMFLILLNSASCKAVKEMQAMSHFILQKMVPSQQYLSLDCNHVDMCVLKMMLKVHGFVTNLVMVLM